MNSYLSQQFLDEDYKSFCPRENGSHLFFKEVGKHTVYKVVHPEHIEIYSIVRPRNKEKGKEEDFFEIIKLIPDYMDMRFFMPNNMDQFYFKSEMKTKGIVSCEKFRKAQITDKQINEIEDVGFFMQLIDPKKHSAFILIPSKNFFTPFCRKLGIGKVNYGIDPIRDIYLASRKKSNKLSPEGIVKDYNSQCYMKFDKIMEQLKSYGTIPVTDMQQSVWNILEKLKFSSAFGFSNTRDLQKNYLSTFEKEGDALDVVIKILKIPGVLQRNYPGTTHDRVNECIGKIFNLKMEKLIV